MKKIWKLNRIDFLELPSKLSAKIKHNNYLNTLKENFGIYTPQTFFKDIYFTNYIKNNTENFENIYFDREFLDYDDAVARLAYCYGKWDREYYEYIILDHDNLTLHLIGDLKWVNNPKDISEQLFPVESVKQEQGQKKEIKQIKVYVDVNAGQLREKGTNKVINFIDDKDKSQQNIIIKNLSRFYGADAKMQNYYKSFGKEHILLTTAISSETKEEYYAHVQNATFQFC